MLVNRDPDGLPSPPAAMIEMASRLNQHVVHIICDEPNAVVGDQVGIDFYAVVPFLPRAGDRILLENGRCCEVKSSLFKVLRVPGPGGMSKGIMLVPNVVAHLLGG